MTDGTAEAARNGTIGSYVGQIVGAELFGKVEWGHPMAPSPLSVREIMICTVWCALVFALMAATGMMLWPPLMLTCALGPISGAIAHKRWGGRGILGGIVAGAMSFAGFGVALYVWSFYFPVPVAVHYWKRPGEVFLIQALYGAITGLVAGFFVWGVNTLIGTAENATSPSPRESASSFDD